MSPNSNSPVIYPLELGHKMLVKQKKGDWAQVLDDRTGLVGWIPLDSFSGQMPEGNLAKINYNGRFKLFKERVMAMSKSIEEAINIKTFVKVEHLGGAAAVVFANTDWFNGRRHQNQAFQVYEMWKGVNQSPSFLSFRNIENKEIFIVLSGPHRPRLLKSSK
tara:strand:- start:82 stop:567 length:486 start_codon:yes stop_codon:yes gene_type:complete